MSHKVGLALLIFTVALTAGELTQYIAFSPADLAITQSDGYTIVQYGRNPNYDDIPGHPSLPMVPLYVVIPPHATVTSFEIVAMDEEVLPGRHLIMPVQPSIPFLPGVSAPFHSPDPEIYEMDRIWPERAVDYRFTGTKGGYRIGVFRLFPVRYLPREGKLFFCKALTIRIEYQDHAVVPLRQTRNQIRFHASDLATMVNNPQDLTAFAPPLRITGHRGSRFLPPGTYEHVILTPTVYKDTFQILADWRTKQGIPSRVFCIESTSVYPGKDVAEKMRNFLQDADTTWGLIFAFIARVDSHTNLPNRQYRRCWGQYSISLYWDSLPCDLYYSDLFRGNPPNPSIHYDWNGNKNHRYGEVADTIDYFSDIYVGMVVLDNANQASRFLRKLLTQESDPDTLFFAKALLVNGVSFSDSFLNKIYNVLPRPPWVADKMYYSGAGNERPSATKFRDSVNAGYGYSAIIGHGTETSMSIGTTYGLSYVGQQTNYDRLNTIIAVCCNPGAFHRASQCLAESMSVAKGGFINVMMNSRYGWVRVAEHYNELFFYKFLPENGNQCSAYVYVGQAFARVKDHLIYRYPKPGQSESNAWKYESFEKNLFGDPANMLPNWSPVLTMDVDHPTQITTGQQSFTVTVSDNTYAPVEDALVCVMKEGEVYDYGLTNSSGQITFQINPQTPGTMYVTVTERNHLRYEGTVTVTGPGASEERRERPTVFALGHGRPNPFALTTAIPFQLPKPVVVTLTIYDIDGREVRRLVDGIKEAGFYTVNWDGKDGRGKPVPSGVYFYRLETDGYTATRRIVRIR
ncbi:hypothetical protein DRP53_05850 [candidate division WOR-3 bacterium]|uniref:T9SS type A sorting domain-containing protein n=1 Tax=candidate division WOR-3 bacterium TaxID=2052148 RepID=A0A660SHA3_UNCW3|nr:MAG: hypothetical protein DRP53_05850 [candidate division WOR-3 bacterium]